MTDEFDRAVTNPIGEVILWRNPSDELPGPEIDIVLVKCANGDLEVGYCRQDGKWLSGEDYIDAAWWAEMPKGPA